MVKLYTDEEMDEKCKDYDPIPMKVAQAVLHRKPDPDKINILNGVIKSDIKNGQPPAYVAMYANQIGRMNFGVSANAYLKEYNRFVGEQLVEQENTLIQDEEVPVYDIESKRPDFSVRAEEKVKPAPVGIGGRRYGQQKLSAEEFKMLMEGRVKELIDKEQLEGLD